MSQFIFSEVVVRQFSSTNDVVEQVDHLSQLTSKELATRGSNAWITRQGLLRDENVDVSHLSPRYPVDRFENVNNRLRETHFQEIFLDSALRYNFEVGTPYDESKPGNEERLDVPVKFDSCMGTIRYIKTELGDLIHEGWLEAELETFLSDFSYHGHEGADLIICHKLKNKIPDDFDTPVVVLETVQPCHGPSITDQVNKLREVWKQEKEITQILAERLFRAVAKDTYLYELRGADSKGNSLTKLIAKEVQEAISSLLYDVLKDTLGDNWDKRVQTYSTIEQMALQRLEHQLQHQGGVSQCMSCGSRAQLIGECHLPDGPPTPCSLTDDPSDTSDDSDWARFTISKCSQCEQVQLNR